MSNVRATFRELLRERILVLDGAMGTMIQALKLDEEGYRGARFDAWNREVRGNNDLLNLSRPQAVRDIHLAYFRAGADIVSTNTFSSTAIAQADYGMEGIAYELNQAGATLAREAAAAAEKEDCRRRLVPAGLQQPRLLRHHLRPATRRLWRAGARPARWRHRFAANRDHLRYAQCQGGDLRHPGDLRWARPSHPSDDLRAYNGPLRPCAGRADPGGVLEFGAPRRSDHHRSQLRARRARDARPHS